MVGIQLFQGLHTRWHIARSETDRKWKTLIQHFLLSWCEEHVSMATVSEGGRIGAGGTW